MKVGWLTVAATLLVCAGACRGANDTGSSHPVTFCKDVAPIIFQNCTGCHRAGEVAPFPLLTYQDVAKRAKQIVRVTHDRYMPPWKAAHGALEFIGDRSLSEAQIATLHDWMEGGLIEGAAADLPPAPRFTDGWSLGEPDLIVKLPESYTVPAEGRDVFRCFVLPLNLDEDKYVTAVDYRPSNRRVVHHALFFLDANGVAKKKEEAPGKGFASFGSPGFAPTGGLGGWAPGYVPTFLPDGIGRVLKKGSDLVIQIHFHPSGKAEQEQSTIGLYFAKMKPEKILASFMVNSRKISIQPGDKNYVVKNEFTTPIAAELIGLAPHAHYVCKKMKVDAALPDGSVQTLIQIDDWDFGWQSQYLYKESVKLPAGTKIRMEYTYDNSAGNPRNPSNPPKLVNFGQQTQDEMAIVFLNYVASNPGDLAKMRRQMILNRVREMGLDPNNSNVLEGIKKLLGG